MEGILQGMITAPEPKLFLKEAESMGKVTEEEARVILERYLEVIG